MTRRPDYADLAACDDPRVAVMLICSNALYRAYPALLVGCLAVAGARRFRTKKGRNHHV